MRIVIIGANGQVGAEVTLLLASVPAIELRPVARSRLGSAFLRFQGVPVLHGSISDPVQAPRLLEGADVVANFALALGTPWASVKENEAIIAQTFEASPATATVVFFSTLAVLGLSDPGQRRQSTMYTKLKLSNERQVLEAAKKHGRRAYVLRLGHVAGTYQSINQLFRSEIESGSVALIEPAKASNVTFTEAIAEALQAIAQGRVGDPGLYDLVNTPQWTWQEVYAYEAQRLGRTLDVSRAIGSPPRPRASRSLKSLGLRAVTHFGLKEKALQLAAELPGSFNDALKAEHFVSRVRSEISALVEPARPSQNSAQLWPGVDVNNLPGLGETRTLLETKAFDINVPGRQPWPNDL